MLVVSSVHDTDIVPRKNKVLYKQVLKVIKQLRLPYFAISLNYAGQCFNPCFPSPTLVAFIKIEKINLPYHLYYR